MRSEECQLENNTQFLGLSSRALHPDDGAHLPPPESLSFLFLPQHTPLFQTSYLCSCCSFYLHFLPLFPSWRGPDSSFETHSAQE